jgi:hypothetical protein
LVALGLWFWLGPFEGHLIGLLGVAFFLGALVPMGFYIRRVVGEAA